MRTVPPWLMGLVGVVVGSLLMVQALASAGWNATIFLNIGEATPEVEAFAQRYLGPVASLPQLGHDGRFFFVQAADPWITDLDLYRDTLDFPAYRARRVLYPLLAGGFGLIPVRALPWTMALVNVVALGLGTWATARLASRFGLSPLFGLAFLANPGMFNEFFVSGAGIVAFSAALWGIDAAYRGWWWATGVWFAAAVLAREVMLLTVVGVAAWLLIRRRSAILPVVGPPTLLVAGWTAWVWWRLGTAISGARAQIGAPLVGMAEATVGWMRTPGVELVMAVVLVLAAIALLVAAIRRPGYLTWGTVGFALLAPFLSRQVWQQSFDMSRALAPVFTAGVLVVASRGKIGTATAGSAQGPFGSVEDMA